MLRQAQHDYLRVAKGYLPNFMKKIAIIGFGFCGRMLFYHLTKNPNPNLKITIFEKDQSSFGPAFSSFSPHYILNVPTIKMSAFVDKPKDRLCSLSFQLTHPNFLWQTDLKYYQ